MGLLEMLKMPQLALAQTGGRVFRVGVLRPTAPPLSPQDLLASGIPKALGITILQSVLLRVGEVIQ